MTAAAFGIVTPFPGTEFYKKLDGEGLIFETNWDCFDEMHSVYKTKYLSKEKIEELTTYCMAKFWNFEKFIICIAFNSLYWDFPLASNRFSESPSLKTKLLSSGLLSEQRYTWFVTLTSLFP